MMDELLTGSYKIITPGNIIELTSKNSLNEDATDKVKYNSKNGLLSLTMKWGEDDEEFNFVLEKF